MNKDILKGKWLEIKGRVKEKWGKLTDNDLGEIEGRRGHEENHSVGNGFGDDACIYWRMLAMVV